MGTALIEKLFPAEVLLECNLRGGKSKTLPVDEPRKKLDQKILGEIYSKLIIKKSGITAGPFGGNSQNDFLRPQNVEIQ